MNEAEEAAVREMIKAVHHQLGVQHHEHMEAMKALTEIAQAQLAIAEDYKELVGDPLQRGRYALALISTVVGWVAGVILTGWGLKEMFEHYFTRLKP